MFSFLKGFEIGSLIEQINCRLTLAYLIPSFDIPERLSSETLGILMLILEQSLCITKSSMCKSYRHILRKNSRLGVVDGRILKRWYV